MDPCKIVLLGLLAFLLLVSASAAEEARAASTQAPSTKEPPVDGPEARVELDEDDFEEGEYLAPKTVLECMILADWACVQVKTVRAIRLWLNIGTNVVQSKPVTQEAALDREVESKEGATEEENHEDQEEPDTDEEEDFKEVAALFSGLGKVPDGDSSWSGSLEALAEMLYDGVSSFLTADSEDEQRALLKKGINAMEFVERKFEARKKILGGHGHHGIGHLLGLITFFKTKVMVLLNAFSTIVQLKALGFSAIAVLIAALQLFIDFKTKSRPLHPIIKVVHLHPRPHVTVNAGADFHDHEPSPSWDGHQEHEDEGYGYDGYHGFGAHDRVYEEQKPSAAASAAVLKSALLERYKNQILASGRR